MSPDPKNSLASLGRADMPEFPQSPYPFTGNNSAFPMPPADPANPYPIHPDQWARRADGSMKGNGFLGPLIRPDGNGLSSEISIGVNLGGKDVEIPTIVPTLTRPELTWLLSQDFSKNPKIPESIVEKAVNFARQRQQRGQPYFAQAGEEQMNIHPYVRRAGQKP